MSDYDFKLLNDKEFEVLCVDLLSESIGNNLNDLKLEKMQALMVDFSQKMEKK